MLLLVEETLMSFLVDDTVSARVVALNAGLGAGIFFSPAFVNMVAFLSY